MRAHRPVLLLLALLAASPASAKGDAIPFLTAREVDLTRFIPAPPRDDDPATLAERDELLRLQATRTPERVARAEADVAETVWRFLDGVEPALTPRLGEERLPKTAAFFARVAATEGAVVDPAKNAWQRKRPFQAFPEVVPAIRKSGSGAWPSGHSTFGWLTATVLGEMLPERRTALFARAADYAESRILGGVHYRGDTLASRVAAAVIAQAAMDRPEFREEFAGAKAELRAALGL